MNPKMQAAILHTPGDIRIEEVDRPEISGVGEVLLRVEACGVCGSDIPRMMLKGAHKMPLIPGHEFSGTVIDLSADVDSVSIGDLVTVPPLIPCLKCGSCDEGRFGLCEAYDYFGSRRDGAYAQFVVAPAANLLKVPSTLNPVAAAMVDPAAIALHALDKTQLNENSTVAIIGAGPIGLFAVQWAKLAGASLIVAIDVSLETLDLALKAGASEVYTSAADALATHRNGFSIVFEGAGVAVTENAAIELCGRGGEAVFVGIPSKDVPITASTFAHFLRNEISLHGSWNSFSAPWPGSAWLKSVSMLNEGRLLWRFMITHELELQDLPEMFEKLVNRSEPSSKVIFRPNAN